MGERALHTFQEHYDMRRNAESILRVFETTTVAGTAATNREAEAR